MEENKVKQLVEAMLQLLDDMGPEGQSVCMAAKAAARVAIEPFLQTRPVDDRLEGEIISLEVAKAILIDWPNS